MEKESEYKPIVLPDFKYYNGEDDDKCPYSRDDVRSKFWWGERMFSSLEDHEKQFKRFEKDVIEWREELLKHMPNQTARFLKENTTRQLCIALYIDLLYGKWCPYDDLEWIFKY